MSSSSTSRMVSAPRGDPSSVAATDSVRLVQRPRQDDPELGAGAENALDADRAACLLDDPVHHREPEPGALADALRAEERLEDAGARLLVHPVPGVGDRDDRIAPHVGSPDRQRAAVGHRVARVQSEIDEHLSELSLIGVHPRQLGIEPRDDGDLLADHAIEQRVRLEHHGVQVDDRPCEDLAPAERQELPREIGRARGRGAHLPEVTAE